VAPLPRPPEAEIPPGREHVAEERDRQAQQATAAYLKERATALAAEGVPTTWEILRSDNPAAAICDRAGRLPDSIVAIASRGHGGASRLTMGSVAMQVAHDSPVPLLVVRSRPQDEAVR
jgi:nucleotide-binding universal stress UspA family protein